MPGPIRPRQGTEICNFGAPSPLEALHWIFCSFSRFYLQFSKKSHRKSGESSEKSSGENRVKSCHVCGCHGFFAPENVRKAWWCCGWAKRPTWLSPEKFAMAFKSAVGICVGDFVKGAGVYPGLRQMGGCLLALSESIILEIIENQSLIALWQAEIKENTRPLMPQKSLKFGVKFLRPFFPGNCAEKPMYWVPSWRKGSEIPTQKVGKWQKIGR